MAFNILIVDDSHVTRSMIARTIKMAGVPVGELYNAENGQGALDVLRSNWVDLVLADINMPVMDGMEMLEKMSRDPELRSVPVVIVSTEGSETKLEKMRQMGMRAFVKKPFMPDRIREVMREVLGGWEEGGEDVSSDSF